MAMPFCTNCGANVEGRFCVKCGTPIGAPAAQAQPQPRPATPPPAPAPVQAAPARKKTSPLVWILGILLGLFLLFIIVIVGVGFFAVYKAKQAADNPGLAAIKILTATNPDIQVLKTDEDKGTVTLRNKKDGKVFTLNFEDIKQGRLSFHEEGGGTVTFGGNSPADLPSWVPGYPGSKPQFAFSGKEAGKEAGMFNFKTNDDAGTVLGWYKQSLTDEGFTIHGEPGAEGGMIVAEEESSRHSVTVIAGKDSGGTTVQVTYGNKKE